MPPLLPLDGLWAPLVGPGRRLCPHPDPAPPVEQRWTTRVTVLTPPTSRPRSRRARRAGTPARACSLPSPSNRAKAERSCVSRRWPWQEAPPGGLPLNLRFLGKPQRGGGLSAFSEEEPPPAGHTGERRTRAVLAGTCRRGSGPPGRSCPDSFWFPLPASQQVSLGTRSRDRISLGSGRVQFSRLADAVVPPTCRPRRHRHPASQGELHVPGP